MVARTASERERERECVCVCVCVRRARTRVFVCVVKCFDSAVEILWLVSNGMGAEQLKDGLKFVYSSDICSGCLGSKHRLSLQ